MKQSKCLLVFVFVFFSFGFLYADETLFSDDDFFSDDSFFSDDDFFGSEVIEELNETKIDASLSSLIFEVGKTRFGGSLFASVHIESSWIDPFKPGNDFIKGREIEISPQGSVNIGGLEQTRLSPNIDFDFFFDTRPSNTTRLYGKFLINYPFVHTYPSLLVLSDPSAEPIIVSEIPVPSFSVFELFSDFAYDDTIYFRFGKHSVKWGVGYFFSPADVINLGSIDPEKPEVQVEGPISFRLHYPIEGTQTNVWFYALPDTESFLARDTALAGKLEFLLGTSELGVGCWYKYNRPPHFMATFTGSVFRKVSLFGEAVFAWGNENDWLEEKSFSEMKLVLDTTIGGSYYWEKAKIQIASQYLFGIDFSNVKESDYYGSHKAALSLSRSEFITKKMSLSSFAIIDFVKLTGIGNLNLGLQLFDDMSLSTGPSFSIVEKEHGEKMQALSYSVSLRLGGGRF